MTELGFTEETLDFPSEDELDQGIPKGTVALVRVRNERPEDTTPPIKTGESQYGKWMRVTFEVLEGEHSGRWATLFINLNPTRRDFRETFETVTGRDISSGGTVSFKEFVDQLRDSTFEAELGPEMRKDEAGELRPTGFSRVVKLQRKADASEVSSPANEWGSGSSGDASEDDLPF